MSPTPRLAAILLTACACASTPAIRDRTVETREGQPQDAAPVQPVVRKGPEPLPANFNPKAYAAGFTRLQDCEPAARELKPRSADAAWAVLRECINRGFTNLGTILSPAWENDLLTRKDSGPLVAKVVALRGGDVASDLAVLNKRRIPLFALQAAMEQPTVYVGRLVLVRVRTDEAKSEGGKPTLLASEVALGSVLMETSRTNNTHTSTWSSSRTSTGYTSTYSSGSANPTTANTVNDTGREVLLRLAKPDPFLATGKQLVVLGRFEGVQTTSQSVVSEEPGSSVALMSVVAYFEPSISMIE